MGKNNDLLARRAAVTPVGLPRVTTLTADLSDGGLIHDCEGNELIDFAGGIGVMNVGHCNAAVVEAIREQAGKLLHTCIHVATYEPYVALCEKLVQLFPHGNATKAMLINTGAEAVENAVKIARQATGRPAVICFSESFHGRTLLGMTLTSKVGYKIGCGPFAPEVYRLPYPNRYLYGDGLTEQAFVERALRQVREALINLVPAEHVAAILLEPVQGEGGFVAAPFEYLRGLRRICDEYGIMLIFDEVQSGFCRTGKWSAYEHAGVTPHISTWAKSLGGGLPIGAVIGQADVMDAARPGTIGGTYGGNPVACAAALATISEMERLNLNQRATEIGLRIRKRLEAMQKKYSVIGDVRGLGAMVAAELSVDGNPHQPATDLAVKLLDAVCKRGVIVIAAGSHRNVLRILSPLVITDSQIDKGLDIIEEELARLAPASHTTAGAAVAAGR